MIRKVKISLLTVTGFLFAETMASAQTCGTSQVTYSGYTSSYLPKWNVTSGCISNSSIFDNGNVGIGTTTPSKLLTLTKPVANAMGASIYLSNNQYANNVGAGTEIIFGHFSDTQNPRRYARIYSIGTQPYGTADRLSFGSSDDTFTDAMSITFPNNYVGIGTTSPLAKLHLNNGSVLFDGTTGATPTSGAGTRMMWIPAKAAFRAGSVTGTHWNDASIGLNSVAFGGGTIASGDYSSAFGAGSIASGERSAAFGAGSIASGDESFAAGNITTASGGFSSAFGSGTTASGGFSNAFGNSTVASGDYSSSFGMNTTAQAYASFVIGRYNTISGTSASWVSTDPLFVIGNGSSTSARANAFTVLKNGNVGIGTDLSSSTYDATYKLAVNGKIRAKEIVVETNWSDFVFEKNYKLNTLAEVEQYITANGHLPEIPTANEIETSGGNLGELVKLQMQKIEELTLYLIEQDKKIIEQNRRIEILEKNK